MSDKTALERINDGLDAAMVNDIPKDLAVHTLMAMEIQGLENEIDKLEGKVDQLETVIADIFDIFNQHKMLEDIIVDMDELGTAFKKLIKD